jgi:lipoprotein Spr
MTEAIAPAAGRDWPQIVAAARACIGTRFRAQGRVPGLGLDCVGLVLAAGRIAAGVVPAYALGGDHAQLLDDTLRVAGCCRVATPLPGDILVLEPARGLRHLAIMTPAGAVHAHAGIGRVVEGPLDPGWRRLAAWRFAGAR